jgi:DnaJ-class molecular chaperone
MPTPVVTGSPAQCRIGVGLGDVGSAGGPNGELYVKFVVVPGVYHSRDGDDLHCDIQVPFVRAALGAIVNLSNYYNTESVTLHPGTPSGTKLVIVGKGVRPIKKGERCGDLILHIKVVTPMDLDDEQRRLLLEFADWRDEGYVSEAPDTVSVPIALAALGTSVEVETDHGIVRFRVPPGLQHGEKLRASRRPQDSTPSHDIEVTVAVPTDLTSIERAMVWKFGVLRGELDPPPPPKPRGFFAWLKAALRRLLYGDSRESAMI